MTHNKSISKKLIPPVKKETSRKVAAPSAVQRSFAPEKLAQSIVTLMETLKLQKPVSEEEVIKIVMKGVLDSLAIPQSERGEAQEFLELLIETDPSLRQKIISSVTHSNTED